MRLTMLNFVGNADVSILWLRPGAKVDPHDSIKLLGIHVSETQNKLASLLEYHSSRYSFVIAFCFQNLFLLRNTFLRQRITIPNE